MKFCSECGQQINAQQKFCSHCGAENTNRVIDENSQEMYTNNYSSSCTTKQINTVFNRDVLINYLNNLQTLEFTKRKRTKNKEKIINKIESLGHAKTIRKRKSIFKCGSISVVITMIIIFVVALLIKSSLGVEEYSPFKDLLLPILVIALVISGLVGIGYIIYGIWEYVNDILRYKTERRNEVKRLADEFVEKERLKSVVLPMAEKDIEETTLLLNDAYAINIIPAKFRNIYGAYFLYENISTSILTLSEVLYHCVLDEISKKLDVVIEQQQEMIMKQAEMIYLSEHIIRQNEEMLNHAIATEHNTALAAQYAQAAAVNTATVANVQSYFQTKDLFDI